MIPKPPKARILSEAEFEETFNAPMRRVGNDEAVPSIDFWTYFDKIPATDFGDYDCSAGRVEYVFANDAAQLQHVLVDSQDKNVFMAMVLSLNDNSILGHYLLDLNEKYGLLVLDNDL